MSDLELLTNKLDEFGFGYRINNPEEYETEANLVVVAKSSLSYVHHFYFKNDKYVRSDTGSEYIIEFKQDKHDYQYFNNRKRTAIGEMNFNQINIIPRNYSTRKILNAFLRSHVKKNSCFSHVFTRNSHDIKVV